MGFLRTIGAVTVWLCVLTLAGAAALAQAPDATISWMDEPGRIVQAGQTTALRVRVTDAAANPIAGATVQFLAPLSGPTGQFTAWDGSGAATVMTTVTDSGGTASILFLTNSQAGPYLVEARLPGSGQSVAMGVTNMVTKAPSLVMLASTARRALEGKLPAGTSVYGPVWVPAYTTVVSTGPASLYASASTYTTPSNGSWIFWADATPTKLFGHSVDYITLDAGKADPNLSNARFTRESWWPTVKLQGAATGMALLPPSLTLPPSSWKTIEAAPSPGPAATGNACALLLHAPGAPGAAENVAALRAFYLRSGLVAPSSILTMDAVAPDDAWGPIGTRVTRDGISQLVKLAVDQKCASVYLHLTAGGYPPKLPRAAGSDASFGGVVLAGSGAANDVVDFADLAALLAPLAGSTQLQLFLEASYAGNAAAALNGLGFTGALLTGADAASVQNSSPAGTPLTADFVRLWQAALDSSATLSFADVAAKAVARNTNSTATAASNPAYATLAAAGPKPLAVPVFTLGAVGAVDSATFPLPVTPDGTALSAQVTAADPRVASLNPISASITTGGTTAAPRLTVLGSAAGITPYTVKLTAADGTAYQGTGTVAVGQEVACTPARITISDTGSATLRISSGSLFDALYDGQTFAVESLDSTVATVSSGSVTLTATGDATVQVNAVAAGTATLQVTGKRGVGQGYTACVIDVAVYPSTGSGVITSTAYLQQTDAAARKLTTVVNAPGQLIEDIAAGPAANTSASATPTASDLICAAGSVPPYPTLGATAQAYQKSVKGGANAQAFCAWSPASGTPAAFVFSTFFGGTRADTASSVAVDAQGNVVIAGVTTSTNLPVTTGGRAYAGMKDVFVAKISRFGDRLIFATYLGGSDDDVATGVAVDPSGNVYVTGYTQSANFVTFGAMQAQLVGAVDAFVAKLDGNTGRILYSTYYGGDLDDAAFAIAVDAQGSAYIGGQTTSFNLVTTPGAWQTARANGPGCLQYNGGTPPCPDAFVAKFAPDGRSLMYATYLGGSDYDYIHSIAVDNAGNAVVAGGTSSSDFPVTPGVLQPKLGDGLCSGVYPCPDAFVTILNPSGTALVASTYFGGEGYDEAQKVLVDATGNVYLTGTTTSRKLPVTTGAFQTVFGGGATDAFVAAFGPGLRAVLGASYYGGLGDETPTGMALGAGGRVYFSGSTTQGKTLPADK